MTYSDFDNTRVPDDTDLRPDITTMQASGKDLTLGISVNNHPGVENRWNVITGAYPWYTGPLPICAGPAPLLGTGQDSDADYCTNAGHQYFRANNVNVVSVQGNFTHESQSQGASAAVRPQGRGGKPSIGFGGAGSRTRARGGPLLGSPALSIPFN